MDPIDFATLIGTDESHVLEFKRVAWANGAEAAKDIAAFANRSGGCIVLGVEERDGRAHTYAAWADAAGHDATIRRIQEGAGAVLRPRDVIDCVSFTPRGVGADATVCLVRVPPSSALVGVADGGVGQRFTFPIRTERGTRFMSYEEVADRLFGAERTVRLRLEEEIARVGQHRVRFVAPILFHTDRSRGAVLAAIGMHGELDRLEQDGYVVKMDAIARSHRDVRGSQTDSPETTFPGYELFVPYALTSMVSPQPGGGVFIDLRASIVWTGGSWVLGAR